MVLHWRTSHPAESHPKSHNNSYPGNAILPPQMSVISLYFLSISLLRSFFLSLCLSSLSLSLSSSVFPCNMDSYLKMFIRWLISWEKSLVIFPANEWPLAGEVWLMKWTSHPRWRKWTESERKSWPLGKRFLHFVRHRQNDDYRVILSVCVCVCIGSGILYVWVSEWVCI